MDTKFEPKPRFPGCPPICIATNLPSFEGPGDVYDFVKDNCPASSITEIFYCHKCKCWHFKSEPRSPSGDSSGTGRRSKHA